MKSSPQELLKVSPALIALNRLQDRTGLTQNELVWLLAVEILELCASDEEFLAATAEVVAAK